MAMWKAFGLALTLTLFTVALASELGVGYLPY